MEIIEKNHTGKNLHGGDIYGLLNMSLEGMMLKLKLQYFGHLM